MLVLIDADPIVYRAGFAAERSGYEVVSEDQHGNLAEAEFWPTDSASAGDQVKVHVEEPGRSVLKKTRLVDPEPIDHALHLVSQTIRGVVKSVSNQYLLRPKTLTIRVLLTGPGNFRTKVATILPYKGNRDPEHKPFHYQAIRDYLCEMWSAEVIEGREADDEVSLSAWTARKSSSPTSYVVATIDKDLDQVPGQHYDYRQHVWYSVSEEEARKFFWVQALAGDPVDNVGGVYRLGVKGATKLVDTWTRGQDLDDASIWNLVVDQYAASQKRSGCPYSHLDPREVALENARLVYMQRDERLLWSPPDATD